MIVYATAGAGHRRAAEAITHAIRVHDPRANVQCIDVLEDTPSWFRIGYAATYLLLVRHMSWVWKMSYALCDHGIAYRVIQPIRRVWNLFIARRFINRLRREQPQVVIVTHFLPADLCSAAKRAGWWQGKLVAMVTDLHPHRFWISREADVMAVATEASVTVLEQRGIPRAHIRVTGIPINHTFSHVRDRTALRQRFGLSVDRLTLLMTSGGTTVGHFEQVVHALMALERSSPNVLQLLVVCGEETRVRDRLALAAQSSPMPIHVFGFVDYMADLMAASDLIVAKAGGLTVSEALASGLPMIFYHVIPGQERMNADYVVRHGAGLLVSQPAEVARLVNRLVTNRQQFDAMHQSAKILGRPHAASDLASHVVEPLLRMGVDHA